MILRVLCPLMLIFVVLHVDASDSLNCAQLGKDLGAMQAAQRSLLGSLEAHNNTLASTLDQYADVVEKPGLQVKTALSLRKSAESFRSQRLQQQQLIERFEKMTQSLILQVQSCLTRTATAKN